MISTSDRSIAVWTASLIMAPSASEPQRAAASEGLGRETYRQEPAVWADVKFRRPPEFGVGSRLAFPTCFCHDAALTALACAGVMQLRVRRQSIDRSDVDIIRAIPGDRPVVRVGSATTLAALLSDHRTISDRTCHQVAAMSSPTATFLR